MKIHLIRVSDFTGSFVELARAVESCSDMSPTESINVAKEVIFASDGTCETAVDVDNNTNIDELRSACAECGVEVSVPQQ